MPDSTIVLYANGLPSGDMDIDGSTGCALMDGETSRLEVDCLVGVGIFVVGAIIGEA